MTLELTPIPSFAASLTVGRNTYASLADGTAYLQTRPGAEAWFGASPEARARALVLATARIDALRLVGKKADPSQMLAFPRVLPGQSAESATLPIEVVTACIEEALALLRDPYEDVPATRGVRSVTLGDVSETYDGAALEHPGLQSLEARRLLSKWMAGASRFV